MDHQFWHDRWEANEIAFHQKDTNPLLLKYFSRLGLSPGKRVFLPLCGKTLDLAWLCSKGYRIVGAELSPIAVQALFKNHGIQPEIVSSGELELYRGNNIEIFVGDIFSLSATTLGPVDAIYDRAALVALPVSMRRRYATHLVRISGGAPQFLISFTYDQANLEGPPFSVPKEEITSLYGSKYKLTLLETAEVPGGIKGKCPATEDAWILQNLP